MRVRFKLVSHSCRNHRHWWIVVQPIYKKLNGRYIEKVGTWQPVGGRSTRRQISINEHRVKYWLGVGATPTGRVQRLFETFDLLPKMPLPFGTAASYETPQKTWPQNTYWGMKDKGATHHNKYHFVYRGRL